VKIAVLDLCVWLPEYQHDQAKFGDLIARWTLRGLPEAEVTVVHVVEGEVLPEIEAYDGYIISGSDKGVYDDTPWMKPLRAFLGAARAAGKPMFGICFGHQIMADVFGGKAEKVGEAEIGVRAFEANGRTIKGHVWHQDQVTQVPPGAAVIASADYCPVAALSYNFPAMSVQFHPEYSAQYVAEFLRRSRGVILSEDVADAAVAQFNDSDVQADLFAKQTGDFFRAHLN